MSLRAIYYLLVWVFALAACNLKKGNRLSDAASSYLREHADNPVDWYEWGDEALKKAASENKPLLISIGYASCHWCHVMEEESFMDTAVARVMNESFICIKVDREERPDLDQTFVKACELLTGSAGWPLNAFALPDGSPFFAGTYYEKSSWLSLLKQVRDMYQQKPGKVKLQAQSLASGVQNLELSVLLPNATSLTAEQYTAAYQNTLQQLDTVFGGIKGAPKFPATPLLEFQLQYATAVADSAALHRVTNSLRQMAMGGIYDQVGGGFARYSVDSTWHIPHFEKMLYDNAQLISVYSHAWQLTRDPIFARVVRQTIQFVEDQLKAPDGGFFSSVNADTPEGEGFYYTYTLNDVQKALPEDVELISRYYQVSKAGNWEKGRSVLHAIGPPREFSRNNNLDAADFEQRLDKARSLLLQYRNERTAPVVDQKIVISWNAVLLQAYLDAYNAFGNSAYYSSAKQLASFLLEKTKTNGKGLQHSYYENAPGSAAFLEDYAQLGAGFLKMYEASLDKSWLFDAKNLADFVIEQFYDSTKAVFYFTPLKDRNAQLNNLGLADKELPSANAVATALVHKIGILFYKPEYEAIAAKITRSMQQALQSPRVISYGSWAQLMGWFALGGREIVVVGEKAATLNRELQQQYFPFAVFAGSTRNEYIPLLENKFSANETLIYVCTNRTCKRPVRSVAAALVEISRR